MSAYKRIIDFAKGDRRLVVEQDPETGMMIVQSNIIELTADEATEFAVKISAAAFPFQRTARKD